MPTFMIRGTFMDGEEYIFYPEGENHPLEVHAEDDVVAVDEFLNTHDIDEEDYDNIEAEMVSG